MSNLGVCGVCTIISKNYLAFARVLAQSYLAIHPEQTFYVLLVDRKTPADNFAEEPFEVYYAEEIGVPNFLQHAFKFDILELNTNVKPSFLKYLFLRQNVEKLVYVDPDICFYSSTDNLFAVLDQYSIVITPHCVEPIQDDLRPSEQDYLKAGVYNLGFIAMRKSKEAIKMLDWWESRCLSLGFNEVRSGLFVDQCWINFVPCFFESVLILKDRGYNMAYWNLHERVIEKVLGGWLVNGQDKLVFFHFSGISIAAADSEISRHQNRFTLETRPDLTELFSVYRQALRSAMDEKKGEYQYSYGCFSNGTPISLFARRIFSKIDASLGKENPFDSTGPYYEWAKQNRLLECRRIENKYTSLNYNKSDFRLRAISAALKVALRILGVERYSLLMQYLSYISILRNQKELFK